MKKHIVILSGAGVSAESGIKTFRDSDGLWENHDVMQVASINGWLQNPSLVIDFYNQRRKELSHAQPNKAHKLIAELESYSQVSVITQNVDNLHELAGSSNVLHLHGELTKARSTHDDNYIIDIGYDEITIGSTCPKGYQLRPHIVWFGESVPLMETAIEITSTADAMIIIGTSLQVYPAASLTHYTKPGTPIYLIDPQPTIDNSAQVEVIAKTASEGMQDLFLRAGKGLWE